MSAAAVALPAPREQRTTLEVYRDDGLMARALGVTFGSAVRLPALVLLVAGLLPAALAIVIDGAGVSEGTAALFIAWFVLCAGVSSGRPNTGGLRWMAPPLLRLGEYVGIIWLASVAGGSSLPAAFALLAAIVFRHYDLVYRQRHRGVTSPAWLDLVAGGWDGRLLLACLLLLLDLLPAGFFVIGALLGIVLVAETVMGWVRFEQQHRVGPTEAYEDEEDEGA